jgi:prepilin-type processing-associated H-X9-DG protein
MRSIATCLLAVILFPAVGLGQALSDRMPGDAMIYVGWKGTDSPGAGYDQSHLKAVLDASQIGAFVRDSMPKILALAGESDQQTAQMMQMVTTIGGPLLRYPSAFYFGGMDMSNPNSPMPKLALVCQAGADAAALAQKLNNQITQNGAGNFVSCVVRDQLVVVSTTPFPNLPEHPLSQNNDFQTRLGQLGKDPVAVVYVDMTAINAMVDQLLQQAPPDAQKNIPQIRQMMGLDGIKAIVAAGGFDGKDWSNQLFVEVPEPRHGFLFSSAGETISDDLMKVIPQTSTMAGAFPFNLDGLVDGISQAVHQMAPDQGQQFDQGLAQVNQMLGIDLRKDLLAEFGSQWVYYTDPATIGTGMMGMTVVNQPHDAVKLDQSLTALMQSVMGLVGQQLPPRFKLEMRQTQVNGVEVHYLAAPLFSPSWAVKDGYCYLGLYPQVVASAVSRTADDKTILDSAAFQDVRQRLGAPQNITSFMFADLPRTIPESYQGWLVFSQLIFGGADMVGLDSPAMPLPPLNQLLTEVNPAGSATWFDAQGMHAKSISPFPGSELLGAGGSLTSTSVGEGAMMVSVLLPSLNRARETANRVKCASDERMIGQAILLYSNDNKGNYPPDLGTLIKTEDITAQTFACPSSGTTVPGNMTPDEAAAWVNSNSDYVYIGANLKQGADASIVVLYEKDGDHAGDGMNVLFADGHVEFVPLDAAHQLIQKSTNGGPNAPATPGGGGTTPGGL